MVWGWKSETTDECKSWFRRLMLVEMSLVIVSLQGFSSGFSAGFLSLQRGLAGHVQCIQTYVGYAVLRALVSHQGVQILFLSLLRRLFWVRRFSSLHKENENQCQLMWFSSTNIMNFFLLTILRRRCCRFYQFLHQRKIRWWHSSMELQWLWPGLHDDFQNTVWRVDWTAVRQHAGDQPCVFAVFPHGFSHWQLSGESRDKCAKKWW